MQNKPYPTENNAYGIHGNNRKSIPSILESLGYSKFRSRFRLRAKELDYIRIKGIDTVRKHAFDFISTRIAPENPENDGKQTPMKNHPVFIAQHATATCCRGCIEKWHKIPKGKKLNDEEKTFLIDLIMAWINREMNKDK